MAVAVQTMYPDIPVDSDLLLYSESVFNDQRYPRYEYAQVMLRLRRDCTSCTV